MNIRMYGFAVATAALLAVQTVQAQPVNGCPAGQESSDPGGRNVTCVPIPDTANIFNLLNAETAARQTADDALHRRIDALTEADIVGRWSVSGTTNCLQSTNGFNMTNFAPLIPSIGSTTVSQLSGTFLGMRTFDAGGSGHSVGTSHSMTFPATNYGATFVGFGGTGAASTATLDATFTWSIQPDGTLLIDDDNSIAQPFTSPPSLVGQTVTIENVPSFVGYISKDKRTITLTHAGMSLETSVRRDAAGVVQARTPRFCARYRVLTRLPD